MPDTPEVKHDRDSQKFTLTTAGAESCLEYTLAEGGAMVITHTYVPTAGRGRGLAGQLAEAALGYAQSQQLRVVPQCSYIETYIQRHPEYRPLVTAGR
ncbi:hypothetical protein Pla175_50790 [Pirellulimonas nuda]|uniref:N-acetyltransferase domain-containing protein n=1 Tax=Pirellulimonas nuda TaxID=2528009 RepID=A0A518DJJ4_9BACT|nr:GNAT family N-acetyltransferase [Pirellulimonas nuda]QDU91649.1 hypothetical protein Pla175_50790 [Pirellulimonas nuda]